ncbi:MAG: DEAD/DEAH box helicase, partial [Candidatus Thermoplasmatota archaeon]|nr:DEAD/DEAH box helicase [Candidatus Thermoplasmatota archaeon]
MADDQRGYLSWMVQTFKHDDQRWIAANAVLSEQAIPEMKPPEPADETIRLVSFKSGMIGVQAPFSEKDRCKALSERRWEKPYWVCPAAIIEEVAAAFPDGEQSETFQKRLAETRAVSEKATATEADIEPDHFGNGKEMMPFQKAGLAFADATCGSCFIADQQGLGKTIEALSYLAYHPEVRPAVIVCPASVKLNWKKETEAWLETDDTIEVINGGKVHELDADIVIINYDILKKWVPALKEKNIQVIIYDESHSLKNKKAARSKAAKELADTVPHKILLTGTPVLNRPEELWHQLQIIDPDSYPDKRFFQWHKRYADAKQLHFGRKTVWDFSGASNLEELAASLKTIMIRRTKDQVLKELPAKRRSTVLIPIDNRKEYDKADKEFLEWMTEQKGAEAAERASHVEQLAKIEYLRQIAVKGKMKQALAWIENFLESGEKLVVFATHKATIHALEREYGNMAVKIDGSVSSEKRQEAVDAFQNDPNVRLFIGNIQAAGVGITLTAASNVVFLELGWTPALLEQCEDRLHRIGQENAVNIYYLLAEKTIDATMAALLESKREVIDQIT